MQVLLQQLVLVTACAFLLFIAWKDFKYLRITNQDVLLLLALYAVYLGARGFAGWQQDLIAGLLLFVLGFTFWLSKLMGAGDAKLYLPVGLFLGMEGLLSFAVFLIVFSVLFWIALKRPMPLFMQHTLLAMRIDELRGGKQIPYGVPIAFATCVVLIQRMLALG
jgi:prepilin peptidase CpaA